MKSYCLKPSALLWLSLISLTPLAQAQQQPPKPFNAEYEVRRNGTVMGVARLEWKDLGKGRWQLNTRSEGTGVAALAAASISESSVLKWNPGRPETMVYQQSQKIAWKASARSVKPLAAKQTILLTDSKGTVQIPYQAGFLDRHGYLASLMSQLADGRSGVLLVPVAEKRGVRSHRYRNAGNFVLKTAVGDHRVVRLDRVRENTDGRSTQLWLARERGWVPMKMLQKEPDGEVIELRITKL